MMLIGIIALMIMNHKILNHLTYGKSMREFIRRMLLLLVIVGLPTILVASAAFLVSYYLMHNTALTDYLTLIISIVVGSIAHLFYRKRVGAYGQRVSGIRTISLNMNNPELVSDNHIEMLESALSRVKRDSEDYVRLLTMLGYMHLSNAIAKGDKSHYFKAVNFLNSAEETMSRVNVSDNTRFMVSRLRSRVEEYRYRFKP